MDEIRDAAAAVAGQSQSVRIDVTGLERLAADLLRIKPPVWLRAYMAGESTAPEKDPVHYFDGGERTLAYVLLLDAVNFCFWPEEFTVELAGQEFGADSRYHAVAAALTRAFQQGVPLWDAAHLQELNLAAAQEIFRTKRGEVPLLKERLEKMRDVGKVLASQYSGQPSRILEDANRYAPDVVRALARDFVAYRDLREYRGQQFPVLKRAQIFVSDVAMLFGNRGLGKMTGLDKLTCFADYRLPQFMRDRGALVYSTELDRRIAAREVIEEGSPEEVEIRANTIHTVEMLRQLLAHRGHSFTAREIDYLIWEERVRLGKLKVRHHRTLTTSY